MKTSQSLILAAIVGVHGSACLPLNAEVITYTMGIDVNCPSGLSE
jgi:hypothetical protein